jgi:hypothetical protein
MSFLDPLLGAIVYGAEVTHLGAIDYGAEVRAALAQPGRRGTELGAKIYVAKLGCLTMRLWVRAPPWVFNIFFVTNFLFPY